MKYQRIKLKLKNGLETYWCGPFQVKDPDDFLIVGCEVWEPRDLPPGVQMTEEAKLQQGAKK